MAETVSHLDSRLELAATVGQLVLRKIDRYTMHVTCVYTQDIQIVLPTSENEVAMTRRRGQALISWLEAAKTVPRGQRPKSHRLWMVSLPMSQMVKLGTFGEAENLSNYTPPPPFGKFSEVISEPGTCSSM